MSAGARCDAGLHEAYADPGRTPPWKVLVEVLRNLVLAVVLAGLTDQADVDGWGDAALRMPVTGS